MFRYLVAVTLLAVVYIECAPRSTKCPEHQHWDLCGRLCEPTCTVPSPDEFFCPKIECTKETADCRCDDGYARQDGKQCIWVTKCNGSLTYF